VKIVKIYLLKKSDYNKHKKICVEEKKSDLDNVRREGLDKFYTIPSYSKMY
jgi:hypothetical protein